jgi:YebC/PmpR family DNA-binding regulatory protein
MSGHSKWSQIKHKKGVSDQKRGQLFSKLAKAISLAAKQGTDPLANPQLQAAIEQAKKHDLPGDNIDRAIKRAGEKDSASLEKITIQAIGPGSVAVIIEAVTDNRNRTIANIKNVLGRYGAKMVQENSLNWIFNEGWKPKILQEISDKETRNKLEMLFIELRADEDVGNVFTNFQ